MFIVHRAKPGQRIEAVAAWTRIMQPAIEANPGRLTYVYTVLDDEPDVIRAFQLYRTSEDADSFIVTPEYVEYAPTVDPYLDGTHRSLPVRRYVELAEQCNGSLGPDVRPDAEQPVDLGRIFHGRESGHRLLRHA